ncbi:hypothetical protein [Terriglobus roseus]|uniref:Right handed beta helix region n=1 Tax=Terriglobus roseus TaxID=392734 RepID=A0A1H4NVC3_9BACT|nr:hypothetical protein [Terriglobus roseus]SEB99130.1 hypothetical protein SAMN05443244_2367 [Terriglobus roseus]
MIGVGIPPSCHGASVHSAQPGPPAAYVCVGNVYVPATASALPAAVATLRPPEAAAAAYPSGPAADHSDVAIRNTDLPVQTIGAPRYFVNSLTGNEANDGLTPATALATGVSKMGVANATLLLYSAGTYRVQYLPTASGITFAPYGPAPVCNAPQDGSTPQCSNIPTIKGSDIVSGWTDDGTGSHTYKANFTAIADPAKTKVYLDNLDNFETTPLARTTSLALVRSEPGSFFITGGHLYLHLADNTSPASHAVEASTRDYGIWSGANSNLTVRGIRLMAANHAGLMDWANGGTANGLVLDGGWMAYNNGLSDQVSDPNTHDTTDGNIVAFTGTGADSATQSLTGIVIQDGFAGRRDTESMVLNDHGAGIAVMSATGARIQHVKIRSTNGHGFVLRRYYAGLMANDVIDDVEVTKSQGNGYVVNCTNCQMTNVRAHDSAGNIQTGSNTNFINAHNWVYNLTSAFQHGLYNGFDDQSSSNTSEFDNHCWHVANNCSTHESDSGVGSTGTITSNHYDASGNTTNQDVAPTPRDVVVPIYATLASVAGGLRGSGNTLIPGSAPGNLVAWWGARDAGDHAPRYTDEQFAVVAPGFSLTGHAPTAPTGPCSAPTFTNAWRQWVTGDDGRKSYCDGSQWLPKF